MLSHSFSSVFHYFLSKGSQGVTVSTQRTGRDPDAPACVTAVKVTCQSAHVKRGLKVTTVKQRGAWASSGCPSLLLRQLARDSVQLGPGTQQPLQRQEAEGRKAPGKGAAPSCTHARVTSILSTSRNLKFSYRKVEFNPRS